MCGKYFKLLVSKREACDIKQIMKEERKASEALRVVKEESSPLNKKMKFDDEEDTQEGERQPLKSKDNTAQKKKKSKKELPEDNITKTEGKKRKKRKPESENVESKVNINDTIRKIDKKLKKEEKLAEA